MTRIPPALILLSILGLAHGYSRISGVDVTCYRSEDECLANCSMTCYYFDECNEMAAHGGYYACAPNIAL